MQLEINKLINSEFDFLRELGWMLYRRENQEGGLTKEELNQLLQIITVEAIEKVYDEGYKEGIFEEC